MIKYILSTFMVFCASCEGGFLNHDTYFSYIIRNKTEKDITISSYGDSKFISSIKINSGMNFVNTIHSQDLKGPDGFFYPYAEPDSIVIEFSDNKKVSYNYYIAKTAPLKSFTSFNIQSGKSKKWRISLETIRTINVDDYNLAK
jgi:hypothetical protein